MQKKRTNRPNLAKHWKNCFHFVVSKKKVQTSELTLKEGFIIENFSPRVNSSPKNVGDKKYP